MNARVDDRIGQVTAKLAFRGTDPLKKYQLVDKGADQFGGELQLGVEETRLLAPQTADHAFTGYMRSLRIDAGLWIPAALHSNRVHAHYLPPALEDSTDGRKLACDAAIARRLQRGTYRIDGQRRYRVWVVRNA